MSEICAAIIIFFKNQAKSYNELPMPIKLIHGRNQTRPIKTKKFVQTKKKQIQYYQITFMLRGLAILSSVTGHRLD